MPKWQEDNSVDSCTQCNTKFDLFNRRHHCRLCGHIFCGECADQFSEFRDQVPIATRPGFGALAPAKMNRTCKPCAHKLNQLNAKLDSSECTGITGSERRHMITQILDSAAELLTNCPVCDKLLVNLSEQQQTKHVDGCLNHTDHRQRNRMIVCTVTEKMSASLGECPICYEDFVNEQRIGRLECMCVFHEKCIAEWFKRKGVGSCPLHNQSD